MSDRTVTYKLTAEIGAFKAQMAQAAASVQGAADKMTGATKEGARFRAGLDTLGGAAGKVGLVAAAGLGAAVLASANFDKAMSEVQAATHETTDNMEKLRQAALDAGAATAFSANEAAAGIEELAKAGVSTADILGGGLTGALDLAAAGGLDVAQAAEISATALTQFKLAGEDVSHVADLLAAGAGKAQGSVADMGMALKQSGLVAAQTGLTVEETTGTLAAFASAGLIGSDAGTSFKTMLQSLTPTSVKARELMEELGISAYDAQGNFVGMTEFAGSLQEGLKGLSVEQQNAAMKTIFGSDAVRAASVVFENGADGIQDWTDKVNDSGFAAETAATRMDNLAGDWERLTGALSTALIGTGDGAQGPLRSLVQGIEGVVNAYNDLSATSKSAVGITLGGIALIGGGLFALTKSVAAITAVRGALTALGVSATTTGRLMRGMGMAAGGLAGLFAVSAGIRAIQEASAEAHPGVEALTSSLLALKDGEAASLGEEFDSLGDSIDRLTDGSKFNAAGDAFLGGLFIKGSDRRAAEEEINALDAALSNLVSSGNADAAAEALASLDITDDQRERLLTTMPLYEEALAGAANAAELAADASEGHAGALHTETSALEVQTAALQKNIDAMREKRAAALEAENAEIGYQASLDAARKSLKENGKTLDITTDKGRANRQALLDQAAAWNNQSDAVKSSKGAHRDAINTFVQMATQMGMNEDKARDYAKRLFEIPPNRKTKIELEASAALGTLSQVEQWMNRLNGKRATTYIDTIRTGARTVPGLQMASGGYTGDGGVFEPAGVVHRGEVVIPQALVRRDSSMLAQRYGNLPGMDQLPGYAVGGMVGATFSTTRGNGTQTLEHSLTNFADIVDGTSLSLKERLRLQQKELEAAEKRLDAEREALKSLKDMRRSLSESVAGNFSSELFGEGASLESIMSTLSSDANNAAAFAVALSQLRALGFDGAAFQELAASGNLATAQQLAGMSSADIAALEAQYAQRSIQGGLAGSQAALDLRDEVRAQTKVAGRALDEARESRQSLKRIELKIEQMEKRIDNAADTAGRAFGQELNQAGSRAKARSV